MKVKNSIKKIGAVAGSAMMVGLTMGSAASLAEFPQPFVEDDGTVASQIVVGSSGKVADVVGAVNLAASMGQAAVQTEEQTASVSGASYGFSATNGATLDTRNDNLYFGGSMDDVRQTLTSEHLDVLADTTFTDDAGTKTDVEYFLYPGTQSVQFSQPDNNEDPVLNIANPASVSSTAGQYLYHMQANFEDTINFMSSDVQGQEIELFGKSYTVSEDTSSTELVLLGSQEEISLEDGESGTITVAGNDHTIETVAVTQTNTAAFRVDGELKQKSEGQSFNLDGETVRVDTVIQTNSQTSSGLVTYSVGSEELTLTHQDAIQDDNGDDVEGTYVEFQGNSSTNDVSGLDVYVGTNDDDKDWVAAGESYAHPLFENVEFHFAGLNPDAGEGASSEVGEVMFGTTGDDTVTASFTTGSGDDASVEWATIATQTSGSSDPISLATNDDHDIIVEEGADVEEDEYFLSDAGDFARHCLVEQPPFQVLP